MVIASLRREMPPCILVLIYFRKQMRDTLCSLWRFKYVCCVCGWIGLDNGIRNLLIIPWYVECLCMHACAQSDFMHGVEFVWFICISILFVA